MWWDANFSPLMSSLKFQGFIITLIRCFVSFFDVEIVFETAMKVWGKHLRPLTPTGTDTSQDMSFRKCYLTSTIFWMMYSSIYSWTGQYWSLLRLLLLFSWILSPEFAKLVNYRYSYIEYISGHLNYPWICANRPLITSWGGRAQNRAKDDRGSMKNVPGFT